MRPDDDFDDFVRARWTATARLAYALTLDHQKAEDLAQEAFTRLWFHWRKLKGGSPEGYLRKIVTTKFLSGRRRRWSGGSTPLMSWPSWPKEGSDDR
ncbi:sigma factor [Kribbella sp. NPDC054772]